MFRTPDHAPLLNARRAGVAVAASLAVAALVSGCGGGDKVKAFQPTQVIVFGDENGAFDDSFAPGSATPPLVALGSTTFKSSRYTINLVTQAASLYCQINTGVEQVTDCPTTPTDQVIPLSTVASFTASTVASDSLFTAQVSSTTGQQFVGAVIKGNLTLTSSATTTAYFVADRYFDCSPGASAYAGNWAQYLAYVLGSGLSLGGSDQCSQDTGNGISHAFWSAKVDDVVTQLDTTFRGELHDGVLVAVLVGQNDIVAAYKEVLATPQTLTRENALIRMREKGQALGEAIKRIPATGARVVFLTVPDMGKAPQAILDGQTTLASDLTHAFNEGYNNIGGLVLGAASQQGHKIVKVDGYSQINALAPSYPTAAACDAPADIKMLDGTAIATAIPATVTDADLRAKASLLNCTNLTLIDGANINSHLWADGWHLAPVGHVSLGALAVSRVRDQL